MKRVIFFLILLTVSLATVEAKTPGIRSSQVGNVSSLISEGLQQINFMDNNTLSDMKIRVSDGLNTITYKLNETSAAKSLYQMLPLKVTVENYSNNEKIFYPRGTALPGHWHYSHLGAMSLCIMGQPVATVACISSAKPLRALTTFGI